MSRIIKTEFSRARLIEEKEGVVIIPPASSLEHLNQTIAITYDRICYPFDKSIFSNGYEIDTSVCKYLLKDAVIKTASLFAFEHVDMIWNFVSSKVIDVCIALKIGESIVVDLPFDIKEVFHIARSHFPPGVENSECGKFGVEIMEEVNSKSTLKVVSSYNESSTKTESRLPFFFGFRIYCSFKSDQEMPFWRTVLSRALINAYDGDWGNGLLFVAISLESFIDMHFTSMLDSKNLFSEKTTEEIVQYSDIREKLNHLLAKYQEISAINRLSGQLNQFIFTPRNKIAHGKRQSISISIDEYKKALEKCFETIWDIDLGSRKYLVPLECPQNPEFIIDDELRESCNIE